jgi:hypothetical protein
MFLVRRKLSSSKPKTVFLTVSLVEALVKNGVERVYSAIGTDAFMKEIAKVARKYNGRSGAENMEVAELVLDVIQAWGEEFLSRRKRYPAFVTTYHNLRKEGLQFKPQYDANRVPIFTPAAGNAGDTSEDSAILNAAIAASLSSNSNGVNHSQSSAISRRPGRSSFEQRSTSRTSSPSEEAQQSMETSLGIFCEILIASTSASVVRNNDTASEIAQQLRSLQDAMVAAIEYEVNRDGEVSLCCWKSIPEPRNPVQHVSISNSLFAAKLYRTPKLSSS